MLSLHQRSTLSLSPTNLEPLGGSACPSVSVSTLACMLVPQLLEPCHEARWIRATPPLCTGQCEHISLSLSRSLSLSLALSGIRLRIRLPLLVESCVVESGAPVPSRGSERERATRRPSSCLEHSAFGSPAARCLGLDTAVLRSYTQRTPRASPPHQLPHLRGRARGVVAEAPLPGSAVAYS